MGKDEKKTHSKFYRDYMNASWLKQGESISKVRFTGDGGRFFRIYGKLQQYHMEKDEKTHSTLHCDQKIASWFKIGEQISGVRSTKRDEMNFSNSRGKIIHLWGKTRRDIESFIVIRQASWFKIEETIFQCPVYEGREDEYFYFLQNSKWHQW